MKSEDGSFVDPAMRHRQQHITDMNASEEPSGDDESLLEIEPFAGISGDGDMLLKGTGRFVPLLPASPTSFKIALEKVENICHQCEDQQFKEQLIHLRECCIVLQRVSYNITRLRDAGFITDQISIIVADDNRPDIAHLQPIKLVLIRDLIRSFKNALETAKPDTLTNYCLGFLEGARLKSVTQLDAPESIWRVAVHILDASVVSYSGVHLTPFTERYFGQLNAFLEIPGPYYTGAVMTCVLLRRRLQCLDEFLGGSSVWVLHCIRKEELATKLTSLRESRLALATHADTLADIWGPMSVTRDLNQDNTCAKNILSYHLGNGRILPWDSKQGGILHEGEVYCHWDLDDRPADQLKNKARRLSDSEILVIGSRAAHLPNSECVVESSMIKQKFVDADRLDGLPGTRSTEFLLDTQTVQAGVGIAAKLLTTTLALGQSYKRKEGTGTSYKDSLLASWNPGGTPDLPCLDLLYGVEISSCTENARRVSLSGIMVSNQMRRFFTRGQRNDFLAEVERRSGDQGLLQHLWDTKPDWHEDMRQAILSCLHSLRGTGMRSREKLCALYCPKDSRVDAHQIKFPYAKWMNLCKDSYSQACFAVVTEECLESDWDGGRSCQSAVKGTLLGKSSLQTSINIGNPPAGLFCSESRWKGRIPNNHIFDFGNSRYVRVHRTLTVPGSKEIELQVLWGKGGFLSRFNDITRVSEASSERSSLRVVIMDD